MQRGAGALCRGRVAHDRWQSSRRLRSGSAVLTRSSATSTIRGGCTVTDPLLGGNPVDMPHRSAARQAAAHGARGPQRGHGGTAARSQPYRAERGRVSRPATAGRGRQDIPHHHRRPDRRWHGEPRSARRPMAGAGERCGGDRGRLSRPCGRGDVDGRAHAGRGVGCSRFGTSRGRGGHHQYPGGGRRGR